MAKLRVYQLARELNRDNAEIIRELQHMGVPVTSHSNTVEDRLADRLRRELGVYAPESEKTAPAADEIVAVEAPEVEAPQAPPEPAPVEAEPPRVEVKAEPKVEPKVEEKAPTPEPKVATPPAPPAPPVPPAPAPKVEQPAAAHPVQPPQPQFTPQGGRIIPPPTRIGPAVPPVIPPPKPEPPPEQRKTMQQIVQERLRQEHRLPPSPPPGQQRRPYPPRPMGPGQTPGQRHPSAPGFQNRGAAPGAPTGQRPWVRPGAPPPPPPPVEQRRPPVHERVDRTQRYERQAEKKLESPFVRPQPKPEVPREFRRITLTEGVTVKDLAEKLGVLAKDVQKKLMDRSVFATINQTLDKEMAKSISKDFNAEAEFVTFEEAVMLDAVEVSVSENAVARAPVVTIMGHVDHGKTSLLDAIRKTRVTEQEAGGITQHIGAYQVKVQDRKITFLDTPGHEAFTLMRARGAKVTDIVVLVVAADDGVMPQTDESISHTRAAKVPIIVAINKIDKPGVNPERVKRELSERGLLAEDWGGDTPTVEVSAKMGKNLELLLELILLVADIQNLKADPTLPAMGAVLEAKIDRGRGNVATVLVQNGTLKVGDNFVAGAVYGKVRAMFDENGQPVKEAAPSTPVEVLGLEGLPLAGDTFQCIADDKKARQIVSYRQEKLRDIALAKTSRLTLDQLHKQLTEGEIKEVPLILKCDVQGSQEALTEMLNKLSTDKVKVRVLHSSVGAITETDVLLAAASNAIIIGFNVRPERKAAELANREKVDIRLHTIIYNVVDEIKRAMQGVLEPVIKETYLGTADVRNTFRIPRVGVIAGCYITDGKVTRNAEIRLLRDNVVIFEGKIASLKRFKEDASEVTRGYECGIGIQNFNDVKIGDTIEAFVTEKVMADVGA
ncbi:MAG TPA: translation initiation factor IF-2 [Terriglobia bacterium]|nr:translation initiation factor IF-2 [Terriglobia bacterium]